MAHVVIVGGGLVGLSSAMLLAQDRYDVTVLERDPAPPPLPDEAWAQWERRGVNQFRMLHAFLPRFRVVLQAELPQVVWALEEDGALRVNPVLNSPPHLYDGGRPGDERYERITGRRPMVEASVARVADRHAGVCVRRGVAVQG